MPQAPLLVARTFARSWRRHRLRAAASLMGVVIGIVLATAVSSVTASVRSAVEAGTAVNVIDVDLVAAARSGGGMDLAAVRKLQGAAAPSISTALVRVNTRLADKESAGLVLIGATAGLSRFTPDIDPDSVRQVAAAPGTFGLLVGESWAADNGLKLGEPIRLAGPGGVVTWTVTGLLPGNLPNGGALAVGTLEQVGQAFQRQGRVDIVGFRLEGGDTSAALKERLETAAAGSATIADRGLVTKADTNAFAIIRQMLGVVGFVGILTAATVLFVCWRLLLDDERANVAKLRLNGVGPRQLVLGSSLVFAGATAACAVVGIPLGLLAARGMNTLAGTLVRVTGLAGVPKAGSLTKPVLTGLAAGVGMSALAWGAALRSFLRINAIEAIRGVEQKAKPRSARTFLVVGLLAVAGVAIGLRVLPDKGMPALLMMGMAAAVLLAAAAPVLIGGLISRGQSFSALSLGREFSTSARRRSSMIAVFAIAVLLAITLTGVAASMESGIRSSVSAWARGDLWVQPAEPGISLRDERFTPDVADRIKAIPGVDRVVPFALMPVEYEGKSIQIWSWDTTTEGGLFKFHTQSGVPNDRFQASLHAGEVGVSSNFAEKYGVKAGDTINLPSVSGTAPLRVAAVVRDYTSDAGLVFASLATFRTVTGDTRIYSVPTVLKPGADRDAVKAAIEQELASYPSLLVWTSQQEYDHFLGLLGQVLAVLRMLALACFVLAILVAATTAAASLSARRRALGLTHLVGAPARLLRRQLGGECLLVGVLAWVVALPIGVLCIRVALKAMGSQSGLLPPPTVPLLQIAVTLPLTVAAAALAVWIPSRRMLGDEVMQAIRYE